MSKKEKNIKITDLEPAKSIISEGWDFEVSEVSIPDEYHYLISPQASAIAYKYNEGQALREITEYVNKTYGEHYSQNKFQATEFIIDSGHGEGFCLGNMLKYTQRYGKKDTPQEWRKDLMKVIHYSIMMLHVHDLKHKKDI